MNMNPRRMIWVAVGLVSSVSLQPTAAQFDFLKKMANPGAMPSEPTKEIAYFKIEGELTETPVNIPPLFGDDMPMSLKSLLERLKEARHDNNVVAIVLDLQDAAIGLGQIEELHAALRKFAAIDKDVYVHADSLPTLNYAAATGASHISLVPTGELWLTGIYGEAPYLRGTLDKIGCKADFEQFEDYKTAAEMILRTGPSPQAQEMMKWLFDDLYAGMVKLIADGRKLPVEKVRALIDGGPYSAEDALKAGLIDAVQHRQDFLADLTKRYGDDAEIILDYAEDDPFAIPDDNIFAAFEFLMEMLNPSPKVYTEPSVAIVYVEGAIMTGEAEPSLFGSADGAFSTTIRKALDKAAEDDTVKAVILRVDSPGGSALASEIILDASRRVAEKKPVVVSMGNVAASGGYYVTCASETIFADANTITASIGVLGGKIVTTPMWEKLGVTWHANRRGKMAGMMSSAATFSDEERAKIRGYMKTVYEIFRGHVAKARGAKLTKPIEQITGGRVFTGQQALELGLVDRIGGLEDAIAHAAKRAGLGEYEIRVIPEPPSIFDMFAQHEDDEYLRIGAGRVGGSFSELPLIQAALPTMATIDPLRCKALLNAIKRIELVHQEGVIVMMPEELSIR